MTTAIFEVFKTGRHNSKSQVKTDWTDETLAPIAKFYNEAVRSAPLVIEHPEDDAPSFGTVKRLIHQSGALFAEAEVEPSFFERIKQGEFKGISISLFTPNQTENPIKSLGHYLKHVGFLNKSNPAVKGMLPPKYSAEYLAFSESTEAICFCESEPNLTTAEQLHRKALYFQTALNTDYETAFNMAIQP